MDIPQPPTPLPSPVPPQADVEELVERIDSLQRLVGTVLLLLLIVSGTLAVFLYWQVRNANRELESGRQQVMRLNAQQQQFFNSMAEFARTHSDFAPIVAKYIPIKSGGTGAPPATAAAPASGKK